jgi:hypothetical protein
MSSWEIVSANRDCHDLSELCPWLNERRDIAMAAKLIPIVDRLTRLLDMRESAKSEGN